MKLKAVTPLTGIGTQITDAVGFLQLEQKPFEKVKFTESWRKRSTVIHLDILRNLEALHQCIEN